jgi:hypothetical protein
MKAMEDNERAILEATRRKDFSAKFGAMSTQEVLEYNKSVIDIESIELRTNLECMSFISLEQSTGNMIYATKSVFSSQYLESDTKLQLSFLKTSRNVFIPGLCAPVSFAAGMLEQRFHGIVVYKFPPRYLLSSILKKDPLGHILNWDKRVAIICKMLYTCYMMHMNNSDVDALMWLRANNVWIDESMDNPLFTPPFLSSGNEENLFGASVFMMNMFSTNLFVIQDDAYSCKFNLGVATSMPMNIQQMVRFLIFLCAEKEPNYETIAKNVGQLASMKTTEMDIDLIFRPSFQFFERPLECVVCKDKIENVHSSCISCMFGHWICKDCLHQHVQMQNPHTGSTNRMQNDTARLKCVLPECASAPYNEKALFRVASEETIMAYQKAVRLHVEAETIAAMEKRVGKVSSSSSSVGLADAHKKEQETKAHATWIIDNVCTLRSGCCGSAFFDYEACTIVKCESKRCKSYFCACCLRKLTDEEMNEHPRVCEFNSKKSQFVSENTWKQAHIKLRKGMIESRIATISDKEVVAAVKNLIRKDLADLGISI